MSHPSEDSTTSGMQLPPFSSLVNSIVKNGSDSNLNSHVQSPSTASSSTFNNSSYPARYPVSERQPTNLSRGHNYDLSYKAPSQDFRSPLNDYTSYRKFENASRLPALQIGSPIDRNASRGLTTPQRQPPSTGRNNHTSTVVPARVMGEPYRRPANTSTAPTAQVMVTPYRRPAITSSAPKPPPHKVPQSSPYRNGITFLDPELIDPQPLSSIPNRESKLKRLTCRINGCNAQSLGKEAFNIHLRAEHNPCGGPLPSDKIQCPWPGCTHVCVPRSMIFHLPTHAGVRYRCPLCPFERRFWAVRMAEYRKHFEIAHPDEFEAGHIWYNEEII